MNMQKIQKITKQMDSKHEILSGPVSFTGDGLDHVGEALNRGKQNEQL